MWSSTVGLINGRHRYLTAETFGFKINSNGQMLKRRQQWTIEPFPENVGPDGSISSAASVTSQCAQPQLQQQQQINLLQQANLDDSRVLAFSPCPLGTSLSSVKSSSDGSSTSDQDACSEEHENVAIKSHLNKYLAVDSFGNVTCDSEEKTENARFTITICSMSQGRNNSEQIFWAFKNVERGYYLGTTEDGMICCNAKMPKSRAELWHLHLVPSRGASFFALKSLGRKRYARVVGEEFESGTLDKSDLQAQVQLDANISWGPETLFQFKYHEGGRYSLLTSDNKLLTNEGKCLTWKATSGADQEASPPNECLFTLEYHSGFLAFRDCIGHYLAAAGRSSILRSRSIGVSRDELFVFESAPIQVSFRATFNNRWVSIKQGVDLSVNQTETTSKFETFQLTYHRQTQNWSIMTQECMFWTVSKSTNTVSVCRLGDYEGLTRGQFKLIWSDSDATCSLKYVDASKQERWIAARKSGQLFLSNGAQEPVRFIVRFQNRRLLNLRPVDGSGFVGLKSGTCKQLEANKTAPDSIAIEYSELPNIGNSSNGACIELKPITGQQVFNDSGLSNGNSNCSIEGSVANQAANVFCVRLNSTKMGQKVFDRNENNIGAAKQDSTKIGPQDTTATVINASTNGNEKESDFEIDQNNNDTTVENNYTANGECDGVVESSATPSVASIISSFSKTKLSDGSPLATVTPSSASSNGTSQHSCPTSQRMGSVVSKLTSTFESRASRTSNLSQQLAPSHQQDLSGSDASSVITSASSNASATSSVASNESHSGSEAASDAKVSALSDQVAQAECCYMKINTNDKYLVVGDNDQSVICDATNKACAQPWILELRSHNSIAIRASDDHAYMQLGANGTIFLSRCDQKDASLWEF